jgi:hypothetical protein
VCDIICCQFAYSIASPTKQWNCISHICYKQIDNATTMAMPHFLVKLDKPNMAKTLFKLPASDLCGGVCAAECLVNGQKVLVVTVSISPNTASNDWKSLIFSNLGILQKCAKCLSFWQGEVVRICQSYWQVTLTST